MKHLKNKSSKELQRLVLSFSQRHSEAEKKHQTEIQKNKAELEKQTLEAKKWHDKYYGLIEQFKLKTGEKN